MRYIGKQERLHRLVILLAGQDDMELLHLTRQLRRERKQPTKPLLLKRKWTIVKPDGRGEIVIQTNYFRTWAKITHLPEGRSYYERSEMVNMMLDVASRREGWSVKCDKTVMQLWKEAKALEDSVG